MELADRIEARARRAKQGKWGLFNSASWRNDNDNLRLIIELKNNLPAIIAALRAKDDSNG